MNRSFIVLKSIAGIGLLSVLFAFTDPDFTGRLLILWALLTLPLLCVVIAPQKLMNVAVGAAIGSGIYNLLLSLLLYLSLTVLSGGKWNDYRLPYAFVQVPVLTAGIVTLILNRGSKIFTVAATALATFLYLHFVSTSPLAMPATFPDIAYMLRAVDKCAIQYAREHQGQYPASLKEVGPKGSGCLSDELAQGKPGGIRLKYERTNSGFGILADGSSFWGGIKSGLWYSDQSGIIRQGVLETRPSSSGHQLYDNESSVAETVKSVARCLIERRSAYPPDLQSLTGQQKCLITGGMWTMSGNSARGYGYVLTYAVKKESVPGGRGDFVVKARPDPYSHWGLRSFYEDSSGVLRSTPEDRQANTQDPPVR